MLGYSMHPHAKNPRSIRLKFLDEDISAELSVITRGIMALVLHWQREISMVHETVGRARRQFWKNLEPAHQRLKLQVIERRKISQSALATQRIWRGLGQWTMGSERPGIIVFTAWLRNHCYMMTKSQDTSLNRRQGYNFKSSCIHLIQWTHIDNWVLTRISDGFW